MSRSSSAVPRLQVLAAALLFSTGGVAVKATVLSAWQVASFRAGVAVAAVSLFLLLSPRQWPRLSPSLWLVGLAYAATLILYVAANKQTTAASAIFLQSSAPLYVLLLSPWLLGEGIRRWELLYMGALGAGLTLLFVGFDPASTTAPHPARGNLLGLAAGVSWALTLLGLRWLGRGEEGGKVGLGAVLCGNLLAFVLPLPWALPLTGAGEAAAASAPGLADLGVVLYLGIFQVAGAYFFLIAGIRGVSALEASLLLLLDPVLTPLWAWLAHGEVMGPWSLSGGGLILLATAGKTWLEARGRRRREALA